MGRGKEGKREGKWIKEERERGKERTKRIR